MIVSAAAKVNHSHVCYSCAVAMSINNRLIILSIKSGLVSDHISITCCRILLRSTAVSMDVELPGMVTEFHHIGKIG